MAKAKEQTQKVVRQPRKRPRVHSKNNPPAKKYRGQG